VPTLCPQHQAAEQDQADREAQRTREPGNDPVGRTELVAQGDSADPDERVLSDDDLQRAMDEGKAKSSH
jgi:hypothetical protein